MTNNNMLKGALILLICLFGVYVFLYPPNGQSAMAVNPSTNDSIPVAIDTTSICMDFNTYKPSTLSTGLVSDMVSIYRRTQGDAIENASTNPVTNDARSIWFDLDTIKKFIYHIEKGVHQSKVYNAQKLGLRLYYASYPDKSTWNNDSYKDLAGLLGDPITEQYEKKHTLVILPTIQVSGEEYDFNPFEDNTYTAGLPHYTNGVPENQQLTPIMAITGSGSDKDAAKPQSTARNHGQLVPPASNLGTAFH
ncbi:MAG TPA: hypothetical protein VK528_07005 [Flavobacterium sp.]|nr:hypothetical protein [Flavobacterium sp.]